MIFCIGDDPFAAEATSWSAEADDRARRVLEDAERAHLGNFGDVLEDRRSERSGLLRRRLDVVDENVGHPCGWSARHHLLEHSAARAVAVGLAHADGRVLEAVGALDLVVLPVEELAVESLGLFQVGVLSSE